MNFSKIKNIAELLKSAATEERDIEYRDMAETAFLWVAGAFQMELAPQSWYNNTIEQLPLVAVFNFKEFSDAEHAGIMLCVEHGLYIFITEDTEEHSGGVYSYSENADNAYPTITMRIIPSDIIDQGRGLPVSSRIIADYLFKNKNVMQHELIHFFDHVRSGFEYQPGAGYSYSGGDVDKASPEELQGYYNDSSEFNAFYQQIVIVFQENFNNLQTEERERILQSFENFKEHVFSFSNYFIPNLTEDNLRKVIKRLYNLYMSLQPEVAAVASVDFLTFKDIDTMLKTAGASQEMEDFFEERTARHIGLVQKYCKKIYHYDPEKFDGILERGASHDQSKYENSEREPYVYITWDYRCKDKGENFDVHADMRKKMNAASGHHVNSNKHHPEYHSTTQTKLNREDRDAVPDEMIDAASMLDLDIAEMIADWTAMAEEKGEDGAKGWADKNVNKRWKFTDEQTTLIYKLITALKK